MIYEHLPKFCGFYRLIGHGVEECKKRAPSGRETYIQRKEKENEVERHNRPTILQGQQRSRTTKDFILEGAVIWEKNIMQESERLLESFRGPAASYVIASHASNEKSQYVAGKEVQR